MQVNLYFMFGRSVRKIMSILLLASLSACGGGGGERGGDNAGENGGSTGTSSNSPPLGAQTEIATPQPESAPESGSVAESKAEAEPKAEIQPVPPPEPAESPVARSIRSGDASHVGSSDELLDATLASIEKGRTLHADALISVFGLLPDGSARADGSSLTDLSWNPTHDAATLIPSFGENTGLLYTNSVTDSEKTVYQKTIGVIGESDSRYLVLGGNPMRNYRRNPESVNEQMHQLLQNSLAWLTDRDNLATDTFNVTIAQMDNGYYFPDEQGVREWLDEFYPDSVSYNDSGSCDDAALAGCLSGDTNLLVISQDMNEASDATAIASAVAAAMGDGIPVLYLHLDGGLTDLGKTLLPQFNVRYEWDNYWKKLQLDGYDIREALNELPTEIASVRTLFEHLRANDYAFDWTACNGENCSGVPGLDTKMQNGASYVRSVMTGLDIAKRNLFAEEGFEFQKLLALTGDHLRQTTVHPMDKLLTDDNTFLRAWYADHAVYNYREINPAQPDLGNFSRSDFGHITPQSKTVSLISKRNFRSAGVYALPGTTITVRRSDNSDLAVAVFVNTQRAGSTHQWATNGYSRPKYLQSPHITIASGETISLTSPYGGPVQIEFGANDLPVELHFDNIGLHPYWSGKEHDTSFAEQLDKGDYDWAELVTPGFEVHSSLDKMRTSIADEKWGTADALAAGTMRYLHNFPHLLAGFQGPGIDVVDEIHSFASLHGYTVELLDTVKHMNADQATCGYGCSGNPYDAYWSFSPVGHGDVHELGHGLEKRRLRFDGWQTHTMTNPYSYYTKTQYFKTTGVEPDCQGLPFKDSFSVLQASIASDNPVAYVQANLWDTMGWSEGAAMFIQTMMSAQDQGALQDGWHLLARLHIVEREFNRAVKLDSEGWRGKRDALGFGQFTRDEADALSYNDWLLIAISHTAGLDYRDYLSMWAIPYSAAAAAQVSAFGFAAAEREFYVSSDSGYCKGEGFDGVSLPVDGEQSWPLETM